MKIGYNEGESVDNNAATFLLKHAQEYPQKPILYWCSPENIMNWYKNPTHEIAHDQASNAQLYAMVRNTAQGLKNLGIEKGDRVIIFIPMSLPMYTAMFACQYIGAVPVFLDSWARKDQMAVSVEVSSPKAIVSVDQAFQFFKGVKEIEEVATKICFGQNSDSYDASLEKLFATRGEIEREAVEKEHTALITFTTGSSGTPKGADRTHRFLAAQHYAIDRHLPYEDNDMDMPTFPIFSLNNIAAGVPTVIPALDLAKPRDTDAMLMMAQFHSLPITCSTMSPSLVVSLAKYGIENNITLPSLKRLVTGGAPVSKDDCKAIKQVTTKAQVLVLYGSTEVEPMTHISAEEMINAKAPADPEIVEDGVNVGKFDEGLEVRFLKIVKGPVSIKEEADWNELCVEKGKVGEIIVCGEHVCENYFNNKEAFTKSKIVDERGRIWHRTGDLGRIENDDLWLVGRVHNAILRGEDYYFPVRSEVILKRLPFVKRAAFLGIEDSALGEKCVCAFSLKDGVEKNIAEFKAEVLRVMEKNSIPVDEVYLSEEIPMDPRHHSKVEYAVLKKNLGEKL